MKYFGIHIADGTQYRVVLAIKTVLDQGGSLKQRVALVVDDVQIGGDMFGSIQYTNN